MKISSLYFVCLVLMPVVVNGQAGSDETTHVLTLESVLQTIRAENPNLQVARLRVLALEQKPAQAAALPDPMVGIAYQPAAVLTARGGQRSIWRVEQSIPFPGKRRLRSDIATLETNIAGTDEAVLEQDLTLKAKRAYYTLAGIQKKLALVQTYRERLQDFETVATSRYEVGAGPQQAILKAQLEKNTLRKQTLWLQQGRTSWVQVLARLLNRSLPDSLQLEPPALQFSSLPVPLQTYPMVQRSRPELDKIEWQRQQADQKIELAQKNFLPDFSINLTYFDIASSEVIPTGTGRDALMIGAGIRIPLWRKKLHAQLEEAKLRRQQIEAQNESLNTEIRTQIADLAQQLTQNQNILQLFEETLLPQATLTVESTVSAYTTGQVGFLDLLDAERTHFNLQLQYEDTKTRYLNTVAGLERALGITSLNAINE